MQNPRIVYDPNIARMQSNFGDDALRKSYTKSIQRIFFFFGNIVIRQPVRIVKFSLSIINDNHWVIVFITLKNFVLEKSYSA